MTNNLKEIWNFLNENHGFAKNKEDLQKNQTSIQIIGFGSQSTEILNQLQSQGFKNLIDNPFEGEILKSSDITFFCGNLGLSLDKNILKTLKKLDTLSIGLLITPFEIETKRFQISKSEINNLKKKLDTLIVVDKNEFISDELNMAQVLELITNLIVLLINNINNSLNYHSLVNLDYNDMVGLFKNQGLANIDISLKEINQLKNISSIKLNKFDCNSASNIWTYIISSEQLKLDDISDINKNVAKLNKGTNIMWSAKINDEFKNKILITTTLSEVKNE